jgi:hypothetical protein
MLLGKIERSFLLWPRDIVRTKKVCVNAYHYISLLLVVFPFLFIAGPLVECYFSFCLVRGPNCDPQYWL